MYDDSTETCRDRVRSSYLRHHHDVIHLHLGRMRVMNKQTNNHHDNCAVQLSRRHVTSAADLRTIDRKHSIS